LARLSVEAALIALQATRILDLEAMLGLNNPTFGTLFKLSQSQSQLFGLLMAVPNVTSEMVQQRLAIVSDTKVAMHRLRAHLELWGIIIQSRRTLGYWLDDETKRRVNALITPAVIIDVLAPVVAVAAEAA